MEVQILRHFFLTGIWEFMGKIIDDYKDTATDTLLCDILNHANLDWSDQRSASTHCRFFFMLRSEAPLLASTVPRLVYHIMSHPFL